jgi:uncharacterized ion transporter superfamily protein YfcC
MIKNIYLFIVGLVSAIFYFLFKKKKIENEARNFAIYDSYNKLEKKIKDVYKQQKEIANREPDNVDVDNWLLNNKNDSY